MAFETKGFFNSTIKQIYQQTGAILSLENRRDKELLIAALKNFEANSVYNWQMIVFPILNGPKGSPYEKYSGMRSKPWAEFDALDSIHGGISGWTLTAEPWATPEGLPALWDEANKQPHSITGALYYLSEKIDSLQIERASDYTYDDSEIKSELFCLENNIETLYQDIYGCDYNRDCSGNKLKEYSVHTHLYQIFDQLVDGGPVLNVGTDCEPEYPQMNLYMPVSGLTYDTTIDQVHITDLETNLQYIWDFIGMDTPTSTTDYGLNLNVVQNGDSTETAIYDLDQAIGGLQGQISSIDVSLQKAYESGDVLGQDPGLILIGNPLAGSNDGSIKIGVESGVAHSSSLFKLFDFERYFPNNYRSEKLFEVGEHEVNLNAERSSGGVLINPLLESFEYQSAHLYRSVLNMSPRGGAPATRPFESASYNGAEVIDETAIWVSNGLNKDGSPSTDFDCDLNPLKNNSLYFRESDSGIIYKLNKCGETIDMKDQETGELKDAGTDFPNYATVSYRSGGWEPNQVSYENPDREGWTIGWNPGDESNQLGHVTDATLTVSEINVGSDLGEASIKLRSLETGSKNSIYFSSGQPSVELDLAQISTSVLGDFEIETSLDGKDIVLKPENTEVLRISGSGIGTLTGNLIVTGDLTVEGTQTIINTEILDVEDANITIGNTATPTDITANGGGITLKASSDKKIEWLSSNDAWNFNTGLHVESGNVTLATNSSVLPEAAPGYNSIGSEGIRFDLGAFEAVITDSIGPSSSVQYTLPGTDGSSGQVLSTNGSGSLSWISAGGGAGDITEVTASSPLTGGGTTGAVTVGIQDASTSQKGAAQFNADDFSTTAGNVSLAEDLTVGSVTADDFTGALNGPVQFAAKNTTTGTIFKGQAVYISGVAGNNPKVKLAKADSDTTMPAFGLAGEDIPAGSLGEIVTFGSLKKIDTGSTNIVETGTSLSLRDPVYISASEAGKLTNISPSGENNLIQNIGKVARLHQTNGQIKVGGAGRTNATPALDNGNIFIGNASNRATTTNLVTEIVNNSLQNIVEDLTPQLGATLDCQNFNLDAVENINFSGSQIKDINFDRSLLLDPGALAKNAVSSVVIGARDVSYVAQDEDAAGAMSQIVAEAGSALTLGADYHSNTSYVQIHGGEGFTGISGKREAIEFRMRESAAGISDVAIKSVNLNANNGLATLQEPCLHWYNRNGNYVGLKAPASITEGTDFCLVLPPNNGNPGEVLTTDGNGNMTWTDPGAGAPAQSQPDSLPGLSFSVEGDPNSNYDAGGGDSVVFKSSGSAGVSIEGNTITITSTDTNTQVSGETIVDTIAQALNNGTHQGAQVVYDDAANSISIVVEPGAGDHTTHFANLDVSSKDNVITPYNYSEYNLFTQIDSVGGDIVLDVDQVWAQNSRIKIVNLTNSVVKVQTGGDPTKAPALFVEVTGSGLSAPTNTVSLTGGSKIEFTFNSGAFCYTA